MSTVPKQSKDSNHNQSRHDQSRNLLAQAEALLNARELDKAWIAYERAAAAGADPDHCSSNRWMIAMLRGDFEAAWRESDAIRARGSQDPHRFWSGEDLTGKRVILRCLHGYGDTVQLMRYLPLLAKQAKNLVIEVAPAMVDLIHHFNGMHLGMPNAVKVITWGPSAPQVPPTWDVQIEINELPYIFRTQSSDLPLATHYLKLPKSPDSRAKAQPYSSDSLRVGIVWASGEWNAGRSLPAQLLEPLLTIPGLEFWNLQGGSARAQWTRFSKRTNLHAAEECATSIVELANLIAQLDLVITPDTLAAHLAGAIGTTAWVMLEHAADWRWQHMRSDSPWYPSLRLFRQSSPQDWSSVIAAIRSELKQLAASHAKTRLVASPA